MTDDKPSTRSTSAASLVGREFGHLLVIRRAPGHSRDVAWECVCRCGREFRVWGFELRSGKRRECTGCPMAIPPPFPADGDTYGFVPGFRGYAATHCGRVLSCLSWGSSNFVDSWKDLKPGPAGPAGRPGVSLRRDGASKWFYVHRVILMTFVGPCPEGMEGCHKDDDSRNNHLSNLYWGTRESNVADKIRNGRQARGSRTGCSRLVEDDIPIIRALRRDGLTRREIGDRFGVHAVTIGMVLNGKIWRHVPDSSRAVS